MFNTVETRNNLLNGKYADQLAYVYVCDEKNTEEYAKRYVRVIDGFEKLFGKCDEIALFSAPGRTEIGGNHTDHQHGCVLAGSVNLDVIAAARPNGTNLIRLHSEGYEIGDVDVNDLEADEKQYDTTIALIKGVAKKFVDLGYEVKGFDAYTISNVLNGSGLSSSAAFEVLVGTIINGLFANSEVSAVEIAKFGQYAENVYYNKPSGLMDQMASSVGSVVAIDFKSTENPIIKQVEFDISKHGYALCIIDSGADHADLTDEYAAITREMKLVANFFGKDYLREVDVKEFNAKLPEVRAAVKNDRAVLRAMHFFKDNERAQEEVRLLEADDFDGFLRVIKESGRSSYMYLQNVYAASMPKAQAVSLSLALCEELLEGKGGFRVHGGGFAGTIQAFVPFEMLDKFKNGMERVLGEGKCHVLSLRPVGGYEMKL